MIDQQLLEYFKFNFDDEPSFFVNVPGRVNLIGEHIDYNGFSVLPISIDHSIAALVSSRPDNDVHVDDFKSKYSKNVFPVSNNIPHSKDHRWTNYVRAAVQQLVQTKDCNFHGMNVLIHGTIPSSAGLSSSSALVIASALSLLNANECEMDRLELAESMAIGERYVGTQGGGMDQAICLLGHENHAVRIDFFPLQCSYVPFPQDHSVVVAHSTVRASKTDNALLLYNRRPTECRLAVAIINALYKLDSPLQRLGDIRQSSLHDVYKDQNYKAFINDTFSKISYTLDDLEKMIGESREDITQKYLLTSDGIPLPTPDDGFLIRDRVLHVLSEALRVEKSCAALFNSDTSEFGELMNESHESCDRLYGISTPELNKLTSIMCKHGALGARLTGAGFGGCAIALVHDDMVSAVMQGIRDEYYDKYLGAAENSKSTLRSIVFSVKPSEGAQSVPLNNY